MNCGFGIVTPFIGTEFYEKLEKDNLIFERDWTKYDEMHSVFKLNPLTPERLEELEIYCTARFWILNTLLDRAKVLQKRTGKKTSLKDFIYDIIAKAKFARNAGYDMINGGIEDYVKVALDAITDAETEKNGRKISMHDVIEMSRFLKILGPQVIQIALKCDNQIVSYVIKTTSKKVEFIKTISGKQNNATMDINIDLDEVINSFNSCSQLNRLNYVSLLKQARNVRGILNVLRLCSALTMDLSCSFLKDKFTVIKNGLYQQN